MTDPYFTQLESPVGVLTLTGDGAALTGLYFADHLKPHPSFDGKRDASPFAGVVTQLEEYFQGRRTSFDVPLAPRGTAFQLRVWAALREIPFGVTCSYGELARTIGRPTASRAVGAANGLNPLSIIVPCHRVIGKSGSLTGYAGGVERKAWLLEREQRGAPGPQGPAMRPVRLSL